MGTLLGESGQQHWFSVFGINEIYDFTGIVYVIARSRLFDGLFDPLYIGQSGEGGVRLGRHEKMAAARGLGATHVHVHFVDKTANRFSIETDLRRQHLTPLNEQPTPTSNLGLGALAALAGLSYPIPATGLGGIFSKAQTPPASLPPSLLGTGIDYLGLFARR